VVVASGEGRAVAVIPFERFLPRKHFLRLGPAAAFRGNEALATRRALDQLAQEMIGDTDRAAAYGTFGEDGHGEFALSGCYSRISTVGAFFKTHDVQRKSVQSRHRPRRSKNR